MEEGDDEFLEFIKKRLNKAKDSNNIQDIEFWSKVISIEKNIRTNAKIPKSSPGSSPSHNSSLNIGSEEYTIFKEAEDFFRKEKDRYKFVTHYKKWFIARG
ncbi:MAG: hypothetical protein WC405_09080 [Syntrophales bacterium]